MGPSTSKGCDFPVFGLLLKRGIFFFGLVDWFDMHTAETAHWLVGKDLCTRPRIRIKRMM